MKENGSCLLNKIKKINIIVLIFGLLVGGILGNFSVKASSNNNSDSAYYDNSNTNLVSTNVQDALDELYDRYLPLKFYSLYDTITSKSVLDNTSSTYVTSDTGIDFSAISSDSNGKGVYELSSTADDTYPIYYYRGAVTDNNVLFAGFCWKIVRTTETGGIKLIYNGEPSNGQCDNTGTSSQLSSTSEFNTLVDNNAYVGYMYGTAGSSTYEEEHANTNDSTIKTAIDTWYKSNMTSYTDKLEDTVWCNDRSIYSGNGYGTNGTSYETYYRLNANKTPSLSCTNVNDRFTVSSLNGNGALTYPVALLTLDEVAYAGGVSSINNSTYYLYTGEQWWVLSPSHFNNSNLRAYMFRICGLGSICWAGVTYSHGVRPAISLKSGTTYSKGDGTANNPYIIAFDNDFSINNGDRLTDTQSVTLSLSYNSKVTQMCISNTRYCGDYEDVSSIKDWTLSDGEGDKTVYVYYKNKYGDIISKLNKSIKFSTSIEYSFDGSMTIDEINAEGKITITGASSNSSYDWVIDSTNGYLKSGNYHVNSTSAITTITFTPTKDSTLSFDYGVSSESSYDKLTITLNNGSTTTTLVNAISGSSTGTKTASLTANKSYTLTLKYVKDSSAHSNLDIGYIKNFKIE